jgi:hypothetical protein
MKLTGRYLRSGGTRLILIEAWNEADEGAMIEPHRERGFGHQDAVRRLFSREHGPHRDLIPADLDRAAPPAR